VACFSLHSVFEYLLVSALPAYAPARSGVEYAVMILVALLFLGVLVFQSQLPAWASRPTFARIYVHASNGFYLGTLDLSGDDLAALLPAGTSSVYTHLQIQTITEGVPQSSQWVPVLILSDVVRPTDNAVAISSQPSPSAKLYYKEITALTGGGTTALDGISTVGKTLTLVEIYVADELQDWRLFAGTTAEDSANGIVRPDDYNATTNAQIWKRVR
jgi:hypothetical protein